MASVSTLNLVLLGIGGYLLWFGIANFGGKKGSNNPAGPLKNLFQGKGLSF